MPQTSDQKLDKIMEMMGKVVVKEVTLKQDITKETKVMVSEAVDPLKSELHELSTRVKVLEGQGQTSANMISETVATAVDKKFQEMQTKFPQGGPQDSSLVKGEGTVIFSGLGDDLEAATKFIDAEFAKLKLGAPVDSYFKGDEFKGMYYHRYDNLESANAAIKHFERSKLHLAGQRISCRPELPIGHRVCLSTVLGLRRLLINKWGISRKDLKVDDAKSMLSVAGTPAMKAEVAGDAVKIAWLDPEWESWTELQEDNDYKELEAMANKRLAHSAENKKKGIGKGSKGKAAIGQH